MNNIEVRRVIPLPLLRKAEAKRFWPILRNFYEEISDEDIKKEISLFTYYFERTWLRKVDTNNLFTLHKLLRTRSTNPAEAFHSSLLRFFKIRSHFYMSNVIYSDPNSIRRGNVKNF